MNRILAYTSPAIGHLFPLTPLLLELQQRGHDIHLRTLEKYVDLMRAQGFRAESIDPAIPAIESDDFKAHSPKQALASAAATMTARARLDGPDLTRAIASVRPDVIIIDVNAWGAAMAAEAGNLPWVCFSPYTPPISSTGSPPYGPGLVPAAGRLGRLRDRVVRPLVLGAVEKAMVGPVNALRADHRLRPIHTADELFQRAPLMLLTTAEPFEYPHPDWDPSIRQIGAMAWEPATDCPGWLASIEGPLALVTTSSEYQGDEAIVRTAIQALADEPYTVIATLPARMTELGVLPDNVRVVEFVPHAQVLKRAVVAVTHGGMGATQKALSFGVPVCVVPFGRDQLEVAARVVQAGAGTRLAKKKLNAGALRDAVRQAITLSAGARLVAAGYQRAGGASSGADAIEQLLGVQSPS